jgi:DNA polymerase-3 subunit delta
MKIKAEQLSNHLARHSARVYLVSGDEPLIVEECGDLIRQHLKENAFDEREVLHVETGFKWEYLLECANALSLFAEKRLIEIRLGSQKVNKAAGKILVEYIKFAPAENVLLIIADKLDAATKRSAWYKDIEKTGTIIDIWPIESQQLPTWLKNRAAALSIQLNDEAVAMLCERIEGNLLAAKQELDKLLLLQSQTPLTADDIIAAVSDSSRYDVFALIDAVIFGQSERCLKILQTLKQEGVEASIVLWAISREIRLLHNVKTDLEQGLNYESIAIKSRIWGKKKQHFKQAAMQQDSRCLEQLLRQCGEADQIIKGIKEGDCWLIITDMLLTLSGTKLQLQTI